MKKILYIIILICISVANTSAYGVLDNNPAGVNQQISKPTYNVIIYPNPVIDGKFFVSSHQNIYSIEVMNVIGQRIIKRDFDGFDSKQLKIELNNCEKGLYLVKISFGHDNAIIKKILVK